MKLQKRIDEGGHYPRGYGFAWDEPWKDRSVSIVCYPIGLNFLFRWVRLFYWWVASGKRARNRDPWFLGHKEGYHRGHDDGYSAGYQNGQQWVYDQLEKRFAKGQYRFNIPFDE